MRRGSPKRQWGGKSRGNDLFSPPPGERGQPSSIEGTLERITFANEETGWSVVRLLVAGTRGFATAVGHLPGVQPGENLRLHGQWVRDRKYGEQFQVESFVTVQPSTLVGMERYLGSGLIRGIGKVTAARLVKHFGLDTLDVIDRRPERLREVEGIGPKKQAQIADAWAEQRAVREVMLFLQSHGVTTAFAARIFRRYGNRSIALVKENPYRLAVEIPGIGFLTADRIAAALGTPPDSPLRAEAGLLHRLGEFSEGGHLFAPRDLLIEKAVSLLEIDAAVVEGALEELEVKDLVVIEKSLDGQPVYLTVLHEAECRSADRLRELLAVKPARKAIDGKAALLWFEEKEGIRFAEPQRQAVRRALGGPVLVITGGPGTGKTTIVRAIAGIMESKKLRVLLCAPTGRAAKRLEEATGREARTIHRLLEFNPRRQSFERHAGRPLEADLLVVDEMSMVDASLFAHLLEAVPSACQLILVGDIDQLPSVGPGNVLRDLIRSGAVEVVALREIFRQARESLIVVNAHLVNSGEAPRPTPRGEEDRDFYFIGEEDPDRIVETVKELVSRRIPSRFKVDPVDDIQVLTPMHRGELGVTNLNAELQALLNPGGESFHRGSRLFRRGDKVMQIRNNYDLGVFNGDLGRIEDIDTEEHSVTVRFDERRAVYDGADLDELVLGYACTIHKAQGSEYPVVVLPLHTQHYALLQRNLLYTGITRGRKLVVIVGSRKAAAVAVRNNRVVQRYTGLAERLSAGDLRYVDAGT
jgi:exodeoxyribonuclease V alpha subunit